MRDNKTCARCFSPIDIFEAEREVINYRGDRKDLFFHPDTCYTKYLEGKEMVARKVTGYETDMSGERISLEVIFSQGNTYNEEKTMAQLLVGLKGKTEAEVLAFINKIKG
jgi:hypothetical protein